MMDYERCKHGLIVGTCTECERNGQPEVTGVVHFCCPKCWGQSYPSNRASFRELPGIETCCICGDETRRAVEFYKSDFDRLEIDCLIGVAS